MNIPTTLMYTNSHEWVEDLGSGVYRIGLTDYAQQALGDIVFVNLPEVDTALTRGESFCDVESVKAVSDIFTPIGGTIVDVNAELLDSPEKINQDCYASWLIEVKSSVALPELMDAESYAAFVATTDLVSH